jgi:hypothetical protein
VINMTFPVSRPTGMVPMSFVMPIVSRRPGSRIQAQAVPGSAAGTRAD